MFQTIKSIWSPDDFHETSKAPYFEGWFYRFTDAARRNTLAVIPGFYRSPESREHAFIMILNGRTRQTAYKKFPADQFRASGKSHHIAIGNNIFSHDKVHLELDVLSGALNFSALTPWPITALSPGAMGVYAFIPFMQCYHAVLSFSHTLQGSLKTNGQLVNFDNGLGYTEKDWGSGFPRAYIWVQCQHFQSGDCSLMVSIAHIPWLKRYFPGFLAALRHGNRFYAFTTYNGANLIKCRGGKKQIEFSIQKHDYELEVHARRSDGGLLHAPVRGQMRPAVEESLTSSVSLELRRNNKALLQTRGELAGLDVYGDVSCLFKS
ncbi:MAG: tocopherol cyclase family protein [candidate division KSB1 bacterium]|nr:tocopherol cyclase family protein [candidate division KSB1 bacterium]